MFNRRNFLKASLLAGQAGLFTSPAMVYSGRRETSSGFFGVHPFVENHPEAVFIMKTSVDRKTNSEAKKNVGLEFARTVIVPADNTGIPVSRTIAVKPNLTAHRPVDEKRGFTLEDTMGICTDVDFTEGVLEGMKALGVSGNRMHIRDINSSRIIGPRGYATMGERVGADVQTEQIRVGKSDDGNFQWVDIPDGVVHRKMPYLWPMNAPDTWTLNLAKFKGHTMGVTLCCKNFQGAVASPYQGFCQKWENIERLDQKTINPNVKNDIDVYMKRHVHRLPRWDKPEIPRDDPRYMRPYHYDVLCQEIWSHRTIDNLSVSPMGLCVVEGIYGRDGDFNNGPNPFGNENNWNGRAWDYLSNIVIFGKDPYLVDIVGKWLGGHEPGNFGFFHIAMERGKLNVMNPMNIPVYEWMNGRAVRRPLASFRRTPLRSSYLRRDYNGKNEPLFHLCDEPFDYSAVDEREPVVPSRPGSTVLNQGYPASHYPQVAIEYAVPETGKVIVEILDGNGKNLEVLVNSIDEAGYHMAAWSTDGYESGRYAYRFRFNDFHEERDIVLNRT